MNGTSATSSSHAKALCSTQSSTQSSTRDALLARVGSISVPISVRLCQRRMRLDEFLALRPGSFIPFATPCGEPLKLHVAGVALAFGEPVHNRSRLGLRLSGFVAEATR